MIKQCSTELYHTSEGLEAEMEDDSDKIDTIETISTAETLNQDDIGKENKTKSLLSNKGNSDAIEVKNNGNLNGIPKNDNCKEEFCEVALDEVSIDHFILNIPRSF